MWPFNKSSLPVVTNETFSRWLRAGRPPFSWFCGLAEEEQEQLALLGDDYAQDLVIAVGYAVRDPELADAGISATAGDPVGEETLARRAMELVVTRILAGRQTVPQTGPGAGSEASQDLGPGTPGDLRTPDQIVSGPVSGPLGRRAPETLGGLGKRRLDREDQRQQAKDEGRRLFGRAPDGPGQVDSTAPVAPDK